MNTSSVSRPAVIVPQLDIDELMARRHGHTVSPNGKLERRIVAALIAHLESRGFVPMRTWDGEEWERTTDTKSAMEVIFNLDEVSLRFIPAAKRELVERSFEEIGEVEHGILLVLGNGVDIVSDWNYFADDGDGFNAAMEAFDPEQFA